MTKDYQLYPAASDVVFAEKFLNATQVGVNGGVLFNSPTLSSGTITLNGTNQYVRYDMPLSISGSGGRTFLFRARRTSAAGGPLLSAIPASGTGVYIGDTQIGGLNYIFSDGVNVANNLTVSDAQRTPLNEWVDYVFTFDSSGKWYFYKDGVLIKNGAFLVGINTQPITRIEIGGRTTGTPAYWGGDIDYVVVVDRYYSPQEVADISDKSTYSYMNKAVGLWFLQDKIGSAAPFITTDLSGNGNNLTFGDGSTASTFPTKLTHRNGVKTDGGDRLVSSTNLFSETGQITMVAAGYLPTKTANRSICSYEEGITDVGGVLFYLSADNTWRFFSGGSNANNAATFPEASPAGEQFFIVGTHDGTSTHIYFNGVKGTDAVTPLAPDVTVNMALTALVRNNFTTEACPNGTELYMCGLWDFALTETQATDLYLRGSKYLGNL